jgi:hypothetical protein
VIQGNKDTWGKIWVENAPAEVRNAIRMIQDTANTMRGIAKWLGLSPQEPKMGRSNVMKSKRKVLTATAGVVAYGGLLVLGSAAQDARCPDALLNDLFDRWSSFSVQTIQSLGCSEAEAEAHVDWVLGLACLDHQSVLALERRIGRNFLSWNFLTGKLP